MFAHIHLIVFAALALYPWAPSVPCKLNPAKPQGLHPDAYSRLQSLSLAHRITQGINHAVERGNVHDTDVTIDGKPYTGAVDISVRCLSQAQIKVLLSALADSGFAAWYRTPGKDGWSGPPHIHAIWAGCRLKPVLQSQVEDWLEADTTWIPLPTDGHADVLGRLITTYELRGNLITDAALAALAIEHGVPVASADADFARFSEITWVNPISPA